MVKCDLCGEDAVVGDWRGWMLCPRCLDAVKRLRIPYYMSLDDPRDRRIILEKINEHYEKIGYHEEPQANKDQDGIDLNLEPNPRPIREFAVTVSRRFGYMLFFRSIQALNKAIERARRRYRDAGLIPANAPTTLSVDVYNSNPIKVIVWAETSNRDLIKDFLENLFDHKVKKIITEYEKPQSAPNKRIHIGFTRLTDYL